MKYTILGSLRETARCFFIDSLGDRTIRLAHRFPFKSKWNALILRDNSTSNRTDILAVSQQYLKTAYFTDNNIILIKTAIAYENAK